MELQTLLIINIAGFVVNAILIFLAKYFEQKAINKAIAEDSRNTTEIVESVKASFQHNLEAFKNSLERDNQVFRMELDLIKANQQALNDEEKNALVQFCADSDMQIQRLSNYELPNLLTRPLETNYESYTALTNNLGPLFTSYTKVEVFVVDFDLLDAASKLFTEILEYAAKTSDFAKEITLQINEHNKKMQQLQEILDSKELVNKTAPELARLKASIPDTKTSKEELLKKVTTRAGELGEYFNKCFMMQRDFNEKVGVHLRARKLK